MESYFHIETILKLMKRILLGLAYFKLKTSRATLTIGPHYQKPQTFAEIETVIGFAVIAVVAI